MSYDMTRGQTALVLVENKQGAAKLREMGWGLKHPWMATGQTPPSNARAETIRE
jgi:putative SOS response-associated peptidase YedK